MYKMIRMNVIAVTMMSRLVVNGMKQRQKGVIVNVSSGLAVYAASKVY